MAGIKHGREAQNLNVNSQEALQSVANSEPPALKSRSSEGLERCSKTVQHEFEP